MPVIALLLRLGLGRLRLFVFVYHRLQIANLVYQMMVRITRLFVGGTQPGVGCGQRRGVAASRQGSAVGAQFLAVPA